MNSEDIKRTYDILKSIQSIETIGNEFKLIPIPLIPYDKIIIIGKKIYVNEYNWERLIFMLFGVNENTIDIVINHAKHDCKKHIDYLVNFKYKDKDEFISTRNPRYSREVCI